MVAVTIQVGPGLRKIQNMVARLPKNIQKEVGDLGTAAIAKSGQRRIVFQYGSRGYGGTGFGLRALKKPMRFKKSGNSYIYSLDIPGYLGLIEEGVKSHWVSRETIKAHESSPGSTLFKRAPRGFSFMAPPIWWQYKGPFIGPAMKNLITDIPKILERATSKAIVRSAR